MSDKAKTQQFVVNVSEETKAAINQLKEELKLGDKGVVQLLLEIANANRKNTVDGVEVDVFTSTVASLGLLKTKVEKVVLSAEEKEKIALEKKLAKVAAQLQKLEHPEEVVEPVVDSTSTTTTVLSTEPGEPDVLVEIGV